MAAEDEFETQTFDSETKEKSCSGLWVLQVSFGWEQSNRYGGPTISSHLPD